MYFKNLLTLLLAVVLVGFTAPKAFADQQAEVILRALINAGVISQEDIDKASAQIRREKGPQEYVPRGIEDRVTALEKKGLNIPDWVKKMKLKGDARLRYQYERQTNDTEAKTRGRYRLRLGTEVDVVDQVKVGFGLATGGTDPKSTNQTFGEADGSAKAFATPDIRVDYVFAEYSPSQNLKMIAGKFKKKPYLWHATDLLWDGDITPEGGSLHWQDALLDVKDTDYWFDTGIWVLEHNDQVDKPDPFMTYVQTGVKNKTKLLDKKIDSKAAVTFYAFPGLKSNSLVDSEGQNTTDGASLLVSTYSSLALSAEVGVKELFGGLPFNIDERIATFFDFIHNFDDDYAAIEKTTGWAMGTKLGNKKVKDKGQWQAKYIYAVLGADAFPDAFPDADRGFGGETDVRSHEVIFNYGLAKNISLGLDYYNTRRYSKSSSNENNVEHIIQADVLFKF